MVVYWISTYYADPNNWIGEMYNSKLWGTFKSSSFYKNAKVDGAPGLRAREHRSGRAAGGLRGRGSHRGGRCGERLGLQHQVVRAV